MLLMPVWDTGPTCMGAAELPSGKDSELLLVQVCCSAGTVLCN